MRLVQKLGQSVGWLAVWLPMVLRDLTGHRPGARFHSPQCPEHHPFSAMAAGINAAVGPHSIREPCCERPPVENLHKGPWFNRGPAPSTFLRAPTHRPGPPLNSILHCLLFYHALSLILPCPMLFLAIPALRSHRSQEGLSCPQAAYRPREAENDELEEKPGPVFVRMRVVVWAPKA